jgi:type III pantothenate kinase
MMLLIDAGNTRIKFGWLSAGHREPAPLALPHNELDQLDHWLRQQGSSPTTAIGVNVAGAAVAAKIEAVLAAHACTVSWVGSQPQALGVFNAYDNPAQLGPDRWIAMLGLANDAVCSAPPFHAHALMLASFGTATTIDTLSPVQESGRRTFLGGLIFPGPALMRSSLANGTANLPEAQGDTALYPTHTHQAIATGIAAAQAGAVLRQWLAGLDRFGHPPCLYAAGGGWPLVKDETQRLLHATQARMGLPETPIHWLVAPVLDGLAALATPESGSLPVQSRKP